MRNKKTLLTFLVSLVLGLSPVFAQKAWDKMKSEAVKTKEKAEQAHKENQAKGKDKGCHCAQESKASFERCLSEAQKLSGKKRGDAVKKCTAARRSGIVACQKTCKATGDAGDQAQCSADCNAGKDEALAVCEATLNTAACGNDAKCQKEIQDSLKSCRGDVEASNTQCLAGCK